MYADLVMPAIKLTAVLALGTNVTMSITYAALIKAKRNALLTKNILKKHVKPVIR